MVGFFHRDKRRLSDTELVDLCNEGERDDATKAFEELYRRHKDFVLRVALRFCHDQEVSREILQETFIYLLKKFPPPGDGLRLTAKLTTFLYPVARNLAISAYRKAGRLELSDDDPDSLHAPSAASEPEVDALLGDLSEERREVVRMRFVDDMSLGEIAAALEVPLGTVKSRLHLAIKQLRENPATKKFFDS